MYVQIGYGVVQINTLGGGSSTKYLPQIKQTQCNAIMNAVKSAARKVVKLLHNNDLIFNPKKEYSKFLKPPSNHPNGQLIYMLLKEKKIGFTGDLFQEYPSLQLLSPEEIANTVVVLFYEGMLDYAVDIKLGLIVDDLVSKIVNNMEASKYIRQLYQLYGCGGNALGMKRILAFHLIEYGLGLEHKASGNAIGEAFMWLLLNKWSWAKKTGSSNNSLSSQVFVVKKIKYTTIVHGKIRYPMLCVLMQPP